MINSEELIALVIFVPCGICVLIGMCSMASHKCNSCCCVDSRDRNSFWLYPQQLRRRTSSQDNPQSYRRLTGDTAAFLNMSFEEDGGHIVTEFDFRQSLHMECGVLALESPPSYTAALKNTREEAQRLDADNTSINGESTSKDQAREASGRVSVRERVARARENVRRSPPPYSEKTSNHTIHLGDISGSVSDSAYSQEDVSSV